MTEKELNIELQELQTESVNNGGMWEFSKLALDRNIRVVELYQNITGQVKITSVNTNEINRMLMLDMYLKRALKGEIDLMTPVMAVQKELMAIPDFGEQDDSLFAEEKKAILMVAGAAVQKLMATLSKEQEILMNCADMITELYMSESALLRTEKLIAAEGEGSATLQIAMAKTYIFDAMDKINKSGKDAIIAFAEGDEQRMMLLGLKRFTKIAPFNTKNARQDVAKALIEANDFIF